MTTAIVLPVIDPDQARECVGSMHPRVASRTYLVDNCHEPIDTIQVGFVDRFRWNLGVARSWNLGIGWAISEGYDAVALLSSQVRFGLYGGLDLLKVDPDGWGCAPPPACWHTMVFPLSTFDRVGLFDENFWCAYGEDADMIRRVSLAGGSFASAAPLDLTTTGDGQGCERLRQDHPGLPTINYDALMDYFQRKWGVAWTEGDVSKGYRTPFNMEVPLSWWEPATVPELIERYGVAARSE